VLTEIGRAVMQLGPETARGLARKVDDAFANGDFKTVAEADWLRTARRKLALEQLFVQAGSLAALKP
jgi:hypothetical protein